MSNKISGMERRRMRHVVQMAFDALPLLRKRLLCMDSVQLEHSMPISHIQTLVLLKDYGKLSASELSRYLGIAKPNITPLVNRLIDEGYVCRERSKEDKRVVHVVLMPEGVQKLEDILHTIIDENQDWVGNFMSRKQLKDVESSLATILRLFGEERKLDMDEGEFSEASGNL